MDLVVRGSSIVITRRRQVGFLTEWQLYAQKIEGDAWKGEKLDRSKIEKMSGSSFPPFHLTP